MYASFHFGSEGGMWDWIVLFPDQAYHFTLNNFTSKLHLGQNLYIKLADRPCNVDYGKQNIGCSDNVGGLNTSSTVAR